MAKHTATFEGVTATRTSPHIYTHALFVKVIGALEARRLLDTAEARFEQAKGYEAQAAEWERTGVVTSKYAHIREKGLEGAVATYRQYAEEARANGWSYKKEALEVEERGDYWVWASFHHSRELALTAAAKYVKQARPTQVVEVTRTLTKKEQAALAS